MRLSKTRGDQGQYQAAATLTELGISCVEKVGTPMKLTPYKLAGRKDVYSVRFGEKVSGDHRGVFPDGRSFLAETKTVYGRNLQYSDLRPHQPGKLSDHAKAGGISALVWVSDDGIFVMEWAFTGIDGFSPGTGINTAEAKIFHEQFLNIIRNAQWPQGYFQCEECGEFWTGDQLLREDNVFGKPRYSCGRRDCNGDVSKWSKSNIIAALKNTSQLHGEQEK